ncbi:hypothetical protein Z043_125792, partial [Scleropages formosus]
TLSLTVPSKHLVVFSVVKEVYSSFFSVKSQDWFDVTKSVSLDVLLTNLIKRNLLPSSLIWITSRPAAAGQLPPECGHQKEEYCRNRFSDQDLVNRIMTHMKLTRSLYIMCHIPVFCWISWIPKFVTRATDREKNDLYY